MFEWIDYFRLCLSFSIAASVGLILPWVFRRCNFVFSAEQWMKGQRLLLALSLLSLLIPTFVPETSFQRPIAQKFSSLSGWTQEPLLQKAQIVGEFNPASAMRVNVLSYLLLVYIIFALCLLAFRYWRTWKHLSAGMLLRSIGRLEIRVHNGGGSPVAFSFLGRSLISIPAYLLELPSPYQMSIAHEVQHLRQGDTALLFVMELLKCFFPFNPLMHWWGRQVAEDQELACDEAMITKKKFLKKQYAACLLHVAEQQERIQKSLVGATGVFWNSQSKHLTRRIVRMSQNHGKIGWMPYLVFIVTSTSLIGVAAYAATNPSRRNLQIEEVQKIAGSTQSEFPLVVNKRVVDQLNRFTRTKEGKKITKANLANFKKNGDLLHKFVQKYRLPEELLAIPFVESGYRSLAPTANPRTGAAGMWQFIASTAKVYGIKDRQDPSQETDAAMRYLDHLNQRFKSWPLAVMSYNAGEGTVQEGIDQTGSRDPWALIGNGYENDRNYLAKVMAAALIIKYPQLR